MNHILNNKNAGQLTSLTAGNRGVEKSPPPDALAGGLNDRSREERGIGSVSSSSPTLTSGGEFEVNWDGHDDPGCPRSMSKTRKWICTWVVSLGSLCVYVYTSHKSYLEVRNVYWDWLYRTCTSSIYTSTYKQVKAEWHVSQIVAIVGLSVFVGGLGIGPMFLGPMSEFFGRRPIYLASFACFTAFLLPCALAPHISVLLVFRFLGGMAGSAFLSVAGGTVGDMFTGSELSAPMMIYTASPFVRIFYRLSKHQPTNFLPKIGPSIGPLIGGFINQNTSWRWTFWLLIIWSGFILASLYFFVPETYHPVLLRERAIALREQTGDPRYRAPIEKMDRSITRTVLWSCTRPFQLLIFEPMVLLLCTFTAVLLGVLYLFFQAFPLVFSRVYHFDLQMVGLTFLGLLVGMVIGTLSDPLWTKNYRRLVAKNGGVSEPEFRLPPAMAGAVFVPIGLFWFAWTTVQSVHWIVPIIASVFFGIGTLLVFSGVFTFLVDAYPLYAASALAANSFIRSSFAAGFPLFSTILYNRLGYQWASTLLAFLTVIMAPFPVLFFIYGKRLRGRSRFATVQNK